MTLTLSDDDYYYYHQGAVSVGITSAVVAESNLGKISPQAAQGVWRQNARDSRRGKPLKTNHIATPHLLAARRPPPNQSIPMTLLDDEGPMGSAGS